MLRTTITASIVCAAAAAANAAPPTRATVTHLAPSAALAARDIRLVAVVDHAWTEQTLTVRYRRVAGAADYRAAPFERSSAGGYYAVIPASDVQRPGVEYYIAGRTPSGAEVLHFASAAAPHRVDVQPTLTERWQQSELARLHGYRSSVSVRMQGHNFDNRNPLKDDYFVRGELEWSHRLLGTIYSITLGYGFIDGITPVRDPLEPAELPRGARYGYAGARFRLHDSVSLDTRAYIGVDRDELITGVRAEVTLGKWWQSSVNLGAEYLQQMGPSLWIRLQWDTVPPFLMGAAIVKTDLPGAELSDGSYIVYDIAYPMTRRLTLRGSISFGSRDGPGNFGGGLGTSLAF